MPTLKRLCLLIVSGVNLSCAVSTPIMAADPPRQERTFNGEAGALVLSAQHLMGSEDHVTALVWLQKAAALPNLSAYEKSVIYQMQGSSFYELDQYDNAVAAFDLAVSSGGLLPNERKTLRLNIAQLLIAEHRFEEGAILLEALYAEYPSLGTKITELLWQSWSQAEQYDKALPWAERWFNAASPKERKYYDVLNFLYKNLNMPIKRTDIVQKMIAIWPEDILLWQSWAALLTQTGRAGEADEINSILSQKENFTPAEITQRLLQTQKQP